MTLDQLRIFLMVAETCHVTRAARALNMTQSAVSAAVQALESQHRVNLFDRVGRGIALTEAGRSLIPAARAVLAQAETARGMLDDFSASPRGHLRLSASQTIATYVLPPLLIRLRRSFPALEITLRDGNTDSVARAVAEGHADIGLIEGPVDRADLQQRVFARDELQLVLSPDHPLADRETWSPEDYRATPWLLREPGSGSRAETEAHLRQMGLAASDLEVLLELPSNGAILSGLTAGGCAALLSDRALATLGRGSGLIRRPITWAEPPRRGFATLTHPQRHRTRAAEALLDLLAS